MSRLQSPPHRKDDGEGVQKSGDWYPQRDSILRDRSSLLTTQEILHVQQNVRGHPKRPVPIQNELPAGLRVPMTDTVMKGFQGLQPEGLREHHLQIETYPTEKQVVPS